jgi:hypothetical protein
MEPRLCMHAVIVHVASIWLAVLLDVFALEVEPLHLSFFVHIDLLRLFIRLMLMLYAASLGISGLSQHGPTIYRAGKYTIK